MNKRLLLSLYDRSGLGAYMPVDFKGHELQVEEHMEEFAESIVKECCTVLAKCKEEPFPFDEDYACRLLKNHFGAE